MAQGREQIIPFYIGPSGANAHSVFHETISEGLRFLEIVVISGGPVFFWWGRRTAEETFKGTNDANSIDFDLASSGTAKGAVGYPRGGMFTLASGNESIGYIRATEDKP